MPADAPTTTTRRPSSVGPLARPAPSVCSPIVCPLTRSIRRPRRNCAIGRSFVDRSEVLPCRLCHLPAGSRWSPASRAEIGIGAGIVRRLLGDGASVFATGWEPHDQAMPWGADADGTDSGWSIELRGSDGRLDFQPVDLEDPSAPASLIDADHRAVRCG